MIDFLLRALALTAVICGQPAVGAAPTDAPATLVLPEGTAVRLRFAEAVKSRTASVGDFVPLFLDEDLIIDRQTVASSGSAAVGTVSSCRKAEMMGQSGHLSVRVEYIKVGGKRVSVLGKQVLTGQEKVGTSIVLTVLFGPIGLMKRGKDVEIRKGTPIVAYVNASSMISTEQQ